MVSLILPAIITYSTLQKRKHLLKKEVKFQLASINKEKLEKLSFTYKQSEEELDWKHSKEFEYNGKMYDVISVQKRRDSISYTCWLDKEETELNIKLKTILVHVYLIDKPIQKREATFLAFYKSLFFELKNTPVFKNYSCFRLLKYEYVKSNYHFLLTTSNYRPPNILCC